MNIFNGLEKIVETNYPLQAHTWYGLGGEADYFIVPQNVEQLQTVAQRCTENNVPMYVLGLGSNVLVRDKGVRGAVIKLDGEEFSQTDFAGDKVIAGAAANLGKLVLSCTSKGLSGLEALTGIPGSVGGAVRMNAGGSFGDIGATVESVTLMDNQGNIFEKNKPELMFDYRWTNITARFILNATIRLVPAEPEHILRTVKEIWIYKKNNQPLNMRNAGCIFRNPRGLSAGALIDRAELKGLTIGAAMVSEKHGNFIIADEGCKSSDVTRLIEAVQHRVKEQFDIDLELELEIW